MRELKVTDVENSTLTVVHPDGEEFHISIDDVILHRLRGARSAVEPTRVSPKDVQFHIRAGLSSEEVAALTGASLDFISRFEGPVLAEREFIVNSALAVQTQTTVDLDSGETSSAFGALIHSRLREVGAFGERWASWKEPDGSWVVKLEFTANDIDHDARWSFEPRKHSLSPLNSDASTLSQKGDLTTGIIPRLRAVTGENVSQDDLASSQSHPGESPVLATVSHLEFSVTADDFTYETNVFVGTADLFSSHSSDDADEGSVADGTSPTADLLEALRRRRGEREATPAWLRDELSTSDVIPHDQTHADNSPQPLFTDPETGPAVQRTGSHARRERTSMPSWDEIVFGTRSDDDTP
jgi:hypothetical protein